MIEVASIHGVATNVEIVRIEIVSERGVVVLVVLVGILVELIVRVDIVLSL